MKMSSLSVNKKKDNQHKISILFALIVQIFPIFSNLALHLISIFSCGIDYLCLILLISSIKYGKLVQNVPIICIYCTRRLLSFISFLPSIFPFITTKQVFTTIKKCGGRLFAMFGRMLQTLILLQNRRIQQRFFKYC